MTFRNLLIVSLLLLTACAAKPAAVSGGSCPQACNRDYDRCMDATGSLSNPLAAGTVSRQCGQALQSCQKTCR